jgi:acetylornithine deacetylase/succinyl-diaminopimelate desuccinylase-like protein
VPLFVNSIGSAISNDLGCFFSRPLGPGERDCQLYLQKRLEALGFTTDLWEPDGSALYAKYEGRPGANKGRTFEGRRNLAGVLEHSGVAWNRFR